MITFATKITRMLSLGIVLVLCASFVTSAVTETCNEMPSCSLFPNQDRGIVSVQDMIQEVQSKHWIMIYYSQFSTKQTYGKCNFRWNAPDSDQNIRKDLMCYNIDIEKCESFDQIVKRKVSDCSRVEEYENTKLYSKFYSQDLKTYVWFYTCYTSDEGNDCTAEYIDLLVSKNKFPDSSDSELDLQGLPWHLIATDLKTHFNMDMSDDKVKFSWKGPECGFDGKVIKTSGASNGRQNIVAFFVIMSLYTLLF
ncbi:uncharacterized protein LOC132732007 [Ruditapes philippinarum]|uniref:uncharacterized protein LOC132732007 n=1 Tax=Ruditapes philippinarum TaxID=129788 RepID=UPI00295ACBFB|nr:uncharacterized protein LOC132732007 [Ruditapes philippinarum]